MSSRPALCLYRGHTIHERFVPFPHRFRYRLLLIDVDIDRLAEAARASWLFSIDKPGLFSFRSRDHADRSGGALRPWALERFAQANIDIDGGAVRLVTFARHLFYKFAPISLWFGYGPDGTLRGVIYEVNNTFGDAHAYVAPCEDGGGAHEADKQLHVSPFFDRDGTYQFRLRVSDRKLSLVIDHRKTHERRHMATISARSRRAASGTLALAAISMPLSAFGVSLGIHWEALKLWAKGAVYRKRPEPVFPPATTATSLPQGSEIKDRHR